MIRHAPRAAALLLLALASLRAQSPASSADLGLRAPAFDGWSFVPNPPDGPAPALASVCRAGAEDVIVAAGQPIGYLVTTTEHADYHLHVEWRWTEKPGNSGILLHIAPGPLDRGWPTCFQIQMKSDRLGDLLPMGAATFAEPLTSAPGAKIPQRQRLVEDVEKPVGAWNVAEVTCRAGTLDYTLNGVLQQRVTRLVPAAGRVGLQFEGQPFELRAVRLSPLAP